MSKIKITHKVRKSNLKLMRIRAGLTQKQLAELAGVSYKSLGNLEQGCRNINHCRVDIVYKISKVLGCDMLDVLELDDIK